MITATDLLSPAGPVDASLFPGEASNVLESRLETYLSNAYADPRIAAQTDIGFRDNLATVHALQQTFFAVYVRMNSQPMTLNVTEKGGHGYSYEQIRGMKALADKYASDLLGLLIVAPDKVPSQFPETLSVRNTVEW